MGLSDALSWLLSRPVSAVAVMRPRDGSMAGSVASSWDEGSLRSLSRRELQAVAKTVGVRGNMKSSEIISEVLTFLGGGGLVTAAAAAGGSADENQSPTQTTSTEFCSAYSKSAATGPPSTLTKKKLSSPMGKALQPISNRLTDSTDRFPPAQSACETGQNPVTSPSLTGFRIHGARDEEVADAETPLRAAPDVAVGSPATPGPDSIDNSVSSASASSRRSSGIRESLRRLVRGKGKGKEYAVQPAPGAVTPGKGDTRRASLRESLLARAGCFPSPHALMRTRTDEWLDVVSRSPARPPASPSMGPCQPPAPTPPPQPLARPLAAAAAPPPAARGNPARPPRTPRRAAEDAMLSPRMMSLAGMGSRMGAGARRPSAAPAPAAAAAGAPRPPQQARGDPGAAAHMELLGAELAKLQNKLRSSQEDAMRRSQSGMSSKQPSEDLEARVAQAMSIRAAAAKSSSTTPRRKEGAAKVAIPKSPPATAYTKLMARGAPRTFKRQGVTPRRRDPAALGSATPKAATPGAGRAQPGPRTAAKRPAAAKPTPARQGYAFATPQARPTRRAAAAAGQAAPATARAAPRPPAAALPATPAAAGSKTPRSRMKAVKSRLPPGAIVAKRATPSLQRTSAKVRAQPKPPPPQTPATAQRPGLRAPGRQPHGFGASTPATVRRAAAATPRSTGANTRIPKGTASKAARPGRPAAAAAPAPPLSPKLNSRLMEEAQSVADMMHVTPAKSAAKKGRAAAPASKPAASPAQLVEAHALKAAALSWDGVPEALPCLPQIRARLLQEDSPQPPFALMLAHDAVCRVGEAVATELDATYMHIAADAMTGPFQGKEREAQDAAFSKAMGSRRAVLALDYLDQQPKGKAARELREQLMLDLCLYLEACSAAPSRSVVVLLATARPETLSPALLQALGHCFFMPLPSAAAREDLIFSHLAVHSDRAALGVEDIEQLACATAGFSVADIEGVCIKVFAGARAASGAPKRLADFMAAVRAVGPSVPSGKAARLESWAHERGECHKIQKYDEGVLNAAGMLRFVPFAVSEFSALAPHAEAFLVELA
eukprot:jgi/Tetstr1/465305/TSEL_010003.t1